MSISHEPIIFYKEKIILCLYPEWSGYDKKTLWNTAFKNDLVAYTYVVAARKYYKEKNTWECEGEK